MEKSYFSDALIREIKDKFYYVDTDPQGRRRLFFENSGGSLRLRAAVEAKAEYEKIPDCPERYHDISMQLRAVKEKGIRDIMQIIFGAAEGQGALVTELTSSQCMFRIVRTILENTGGTNVVVSSIEHPSAFDSVTVYAKRTGREVRVAKANPETGAVEVEEVLRHVDKDTALISVMAVNNEIGTIQPIREIGRIARAHGIPFHTDAVQAIGYLPVDVNDWQADLLSLSAHKFRGPKGVGALYVRRGFLPETLLHGGAQERGRRAGTENVPGIVGLGCAIAAAAAAQPEATARLTALRDRLIRGVLDAVPGSRLIGHPTLRQAGNANLSFPGVDQEILLRQLELRGILASAGAACSSGQTEPSHVLAALGLDWEAVTGAIRFSLGTETTGEDIETALAEIPAAVQDARAVQGL